MAITIGSNFDLATQLPLDSRVVKADLTARDAIASGIRYDGLTVYVISELTSYQLQGGITNGDWVDLSDTGVTPVDDILDWSTNKYTPWSDANKAAGRLYTYTTTFPSNGSNFLAYDGNFYATFFKSLSGFRTDNGADVGAINATAFYLSINGTSRTHFAPTTASGQVANWLDTSSTFTAGTLLSIRNNGTEKFSVDYNGNVNIPTGATYQINGTPIGGGSSQWTTTGSDIYFANRATIGSTKAPDTTLYLDGVAAPWIGLALSGSNKAYIGLSGGAGQLIQDSVAGDLGFRSNGYKIQFSTDSGTTSHLTINDGKVFIGASSAPNAAATFAAVGYNLLTNVVNGADSWFPFSDGNVYITGDATGTGGDTVIRKRTASTYIVSCTFKNNGYVAIGDHNPSHLFHPRGSEPTGWLARFENTYTGGANVYMAHGGGYGMHINAGANATSGTYGFQVVTAGLEAFYVRGDSRIAVGGTDPNLGGAATSKFTIFNDSSSSLVLAKTNNSKILAVNPDTDNGCTFYNGLNGSWTAAFTLNNSTIKIIQSIRGATVRPSDSGCGGIDFYDTSWGYQYATKIYTFKSPSEYYGFTNDYGVGSSAELSCISNGSMAFFAYGNTTAKVTLNMSTGYTVNVAGTIYASGNITGNSDIRYKTVLGKESGIWNKGYADLDIIIFKYNDVERDTEPTVGYSAQNLQEYFPECVSSDENGRLGIKMLPVMALNTLAIQELRKELLELKEELKQLKQN